MKSDEVTVLINYRIEQAQNALDDAKYLMEGGRSPQSIVNRAYYAMFYACPALLQKISKAPSKHSGVISLIDKEFVKCGILPQRLSKNLHRAFELRQISDYRAIQTISAEQAHEVYEKAEDFVKVTREYLL